MRQRILNAALLGSCLAGGGTAHAVNNLVVNPSFETASPKGWGTFSSYAYSQGYTGAAPAGAGSRYFTGTPGQAFGTRSQTVSLVGRESAVDSGGATFNLSAFFSTYLAQNDHSAIVATFRNSAGGALGSSTIGGLPFVQGLGGGGGLRAWGQDAQSGAIPVGTRSISVDINTTRLAGGAADGYVDLVDFGVNNVGSVPVNTNLLVNPGFELPSPTGWGTFSSYAYSQGYTGAAPAGAGNRYFTGDPGVAFGTHTQTIDLTGREGDVDAGTIGFNLSAFFSTYFTQNDNSAIVASFIDGTGNTISDSAPIGGLAFIQALGTEPSGLRRWAQDFTSGQVPAGTRAVQVTIATTRLAGGAADGYLDQIDFQITGGTSPPTNGGVPEPSTIALGALAAAALAQRRRRARSSHGTGRDSPPAFSHNQASSIGISPYPCGGTQAGRTIDDEEASY